MGPFAAKRAEPRLSLQEELVVAIHGAFEVAVEIAVQEVTKLVGQLTGDGYEEMRRENECLKRRLQRAEALLDAVEGEGDACLQRKSPGPTAGSVHGRTGVKGDASAPVERPPDPRHKPRAPVQRQGGDVETQHGGDSASHPQGGYGGVREEMSRVCAIRTEDAIQPRQELASNSKDLPLAPGKDDKPPVEPVTVKQESADEDTDGQDCCFDSIKLEDFSLECMSEVQSKMLEEWKPEVFDVHSQDSVSSLTRTSQSQAHPSDVASALPPPTHPPSVSSDFPNIFQLAESASAPAEAPSQVYGVQVQTGRTLSHSYACKHCGQMFHLPSLLRRHSGQCQQRTQQRVPQPAMGSRRSRLQLYPPGCSPFRCTVCSREFNRMENLKTHLRIHTGERPYTCSVCAKCFRHSGALTRHFRIHTGEKPYVCAQCGKSFRNCGGLKFHQRSHSKQT